MGRDELGHGADLAGADDADGLGVLAVDAQHLADALLLAALGVPDVVVRGDLAREDAEVGQPADERVGSGLEDARQQRPVGRSAPPRPALPSPSSAWIGFSSSGDGK